MKSYAFAYYVDGKFIGWHADSFGSVRDTPKLYSDAEKVKSILAKNLGIKLKKINSENSEQTSVKVGTLGEAIGLFTFDSENLLRGKNVELRIVECPYYDGPNPEFSREEYNKQVDLHDLAWKNSGIEQTTEILSKERRDAYKLWETLNPPPPYEGWIYADFAKVKIWAASEPSVFVGVVKPEL